MLYLVCKCVLFQVTLVIIVIFYHLFYLNNNCQLGWKNVFSVHNKCLIQNRIQNILSVQKISKSWYWSEYIVWIIIVLKLYQHRLYAILIAFGFVLNFGGLWFWYALLTLTYKLLFDMSKVCFEFSLVYMSVLFWVIFVIPALLLYLYLPLYFMIKQEHWLFQE